MFESDVLSFKFNGFTITSGLLKIAAVVGWFLMKKMEILWNDGLQFIVNSSIL